MPFDGIDYVGVSLIGRGPTHPGETYSAVVCALGLQGAFAFAKRRGALSYQQYRRKWDLRDYAADTESAILATSFVEIDRSRRWLPDHATHVIFEAILELDAAAESTLSARITVDDGTDQDVGDTVTIDDIPAHPLNEDRIQRISAEIVDPFDPAQNVIVVIRGGVEIRDVTLGQRSDLIVEAWAEHMDGGSGVPVTCHTVGRGWVSLG